MAGETDDPLKDDPDLRDLVEKSDKQLQDMGLLNEEGSR